MDGVLVNGIGWGVSKLDGVMGCSFRGWGVYMGWSFINGIGS